MKKYDSILKRVEQVEYKLGVTYAKTNGKLYKTAWITALIGVIYLSVINLLVILSAVMNNAVGKTEIFPKGTLLLLGLSVVMEITAVIFTKTKLKIAGGIIGIIPVPYLLFVFIKACYSYGEGLWNMKTIFYTRHLPGIVIAAITFGVMLFISSREVIRTNRSYKRIITNLYSNYLNEQKNANLDVSDDDWEEFIKNYSPKNSLGE